MLKTDITCEQCHKIMNMPLGIIIEVYLACRQDDEDCVPGFLCDECVITLA